MFVIIRVPFPFLASYFSFFLSLQTNIQKRIPLAFSDCHAAKHIVSNVALHLLWLINYVPVLSFEPLLFELDGRVSRPRGDLLFRISRIFRSTKCLNGDWQLRVFRIVLVAAVPLIRLQESEVIH